MVFSAARSYHPVGFAHPFGARCGKSKLPQSKMIKTVLAGASVAIASQLVGCASIVNGQNQPVSVATPGCAAAACELRNDKGKWYVPMTPGAVTVNRSYDDLQVVCTKEGASAATSSVKSSTKGMAFGNILFGGLIGAGVDVATGAAYDYPTEISVPMSCAATPAQPTVAQITASVATVAAKPKFTLGCTAKDVTADMALAAGLQSAKGVMVTAVQPGSVAEKASIKVGDILLEIGQKTITSAEQLRGLLDTQDEAKPASVKVYRERRYIEVTLNFSNKVEI